MILSWTASFTLLPSLLATFFGSGDLLSVFRLLSKAASFPHRYLGTVPICFSDGLAII